MIHWLYKYIFRGFGILFAIGMITSLLISLLGQLRHEQANDQVRPVNAAPARSAR